MSLTFEDFDEATVEASGVTVHARTAGAGPALLLLHGYPESSLMWRHVAPVLAEQFSVVVTDLRGYGHSSAPPDDAEHLTYSKRAMADDQVAVMDALGHDTFYVAGHDRGGRVAHRLTLDHPHRVARVAVLDIVPTLHMFQNVDRLMAQTYYHWFFLSQPDGLPERLIGGDPRGWVESRFKGRSAGAWQLEPEVLTAYASHFEHPERVAATCADYRAAATVDLVHDRGDHTVHLVEVPLLAVWGASSYVGRTFDVVDVWSGYATDVTGVQAPCDHYVPEEAPRFTATVLADFFADGSPR